MTQPKGRHCPGPLNTPGVTVYGKSALSDRVFTIPDEVVAQAACGTCHTILVCQSGNVFAFGENDSGQCGVEGERIRRPTAIGSLCTSKVVHAACGTNFTLFVDQEGGLHACGANRYGQLGLGHADPCAVPVRVPDVPPVRSVAAGECHSLVLTTIGELYTVGSNADGQLALGHTESQSSFARVLFPEAAKKIACGRFQSAVLTTAGKLWAAGSNFYGTLGLGPLSVHKYVFTEVKLRAPVVDFACGQLHMVALLTDGSVWSWGQNYYGQLGIGDGLDVSRSPVQCLLLEEVAVSRVYAGEDHTGLISADGNAWVCGSGDEGELGRLEESHDIPTLVEKFADAVSLQVAFAESYAVHLVGKSAVKPVAKVVPREEPLAWEKSLMTTLECPICLRVMCAPIYQCNKGHNMCSACAARVQICSLCRAPFSGTRNLALESLGADLRLPCPDCLERMPVPGIEKHGLTCPERMRACPISGGACGWRGPVGKLFGHVSNAHKERAWEESPRSFSFSLVDATKSSVLSLYGEIFVLYFRYDGRNHEFSAAAMLIGGDNSAAGMYKLEVEFVTIEGNMRMVICADLSTDTDDKEKIFANGIKLSRKKFGIFFKSARLVCRVSVITTKVYDAEVDSLKLAFL